MEEGGRLLERARRRRLRGGRPLALELVYLPHWLVVYEALEAGSAGQMNSDEQLAILVCRLSGQAAHIRLQDVDVAPGPEPLPPTLEPARAEERAADFAGRVLLMAARGKRRRKRGRLLRSEPCCYPYWVEYVEHGRDVDFHAVDAVSGKRAGAAVRGAIAQGIAGGG